jgi:hypothetical protein
MSFKTYIGKKAWVVLCLEAFDLDFDWLAGAVSKGEQDVRAETG